MAALALSCLMLFLSGASGEFFSFPGEVSYSPLCGHWSAEFNVTLTSKDMTRYGSNVCLHTMSGRWDVMMTIWPVCCIDLTAHQYVGEQRAGEMCHVIHKSRDVYTISVSRYLNASEGGRVLQLELGKPIPYNRFGVSSKIGVLPKADPRTTVRHPEMWFRIGEEPFQKVGPNLSLSVTACRDKFLPVEFCAGEKSDEVSNLKIFANGRETRGQAECLVAGYYLDASDSADGEIRLQYDDGMCRRHWDVKVTVSERDPSECGVSNCDVEEEETLATSAGTLEEETNGTEVGISKEEAVVTETPKEAITLFNACDRRPGWKAREIVNLTDGGEALCQRDADGKNWLVFQHRHSLDVDFYGDWDLYTGGFGSLSSNFWFGLDNVHQLCHQAGACALRVVLEYNGKRYKGTYQDFYLGGPADNYTLHVGKFYGSTGESLYEFANGSAFTTKDRDNDKDDRWNCAQEFHGAWWYKNCHKSNLNGLWGSKTYGKGLTWFSLTGNKDSVTMSDMSLRLY